MSVHIPDETEWHPKLGQGSAHSVSEKPSRRKKHPVGFAPPPKPAVKKKAKP